jgi:guanylate kinase
MMQEIKDGYFLQYIIYPNGEFYGTKASAYPASGPCTIAVAAATMPLFYEFGFHRIAPVYVVPPTYEEWMKRIDAHHEKDLRPRFIEAKASIEAALADARYYFMVNKDLIESGGMFRDIAYGRVQSDAIAQQGARKTALELLAHVETD